MKVCYQEKMWN